MKSSSQRNRRKKPGSMESWECREVRMLRREICVSYTYFESLSQISIK